MSAEDQDERSENERFYDDVLATKLREVAALCKDRNMPMVAFVWFDNDEGFGQTGAMANNDVPAWLVTTLAHCDRNIDRFLLAVGKRFGHNCGTLALRAMGFPDPPAPRPTAEG